MKIKLIKKTEKFTGKTYYYVTIDGELYNGYEYSYVRTEKDAEKLFDDAIESAKKFPKKRKEIIRSVNL